MSTAVTAGVSTRDRVDWRHGAACLGTDPELWHPVGDSGPALLQVAEAKTICRRCTVVDACRDDAVVHRDSGVRGGMSDAERDHYMRALRSGMFR